MGTASNIIIGGVVLIGGYYLYKNPQYVDQFFAQLNVPNPFTEISNWFNNGNTTPTPTPTPDPSEGQSKDEKKKDSKMGSITYQGSEYPMFNRKKLLLSGPPYLCSIDYPVTVQSVKTNDKRTTWQNDRITWNSVNPLYLPVKKVR